MKDHKLALIKGLNDQGFLIFLTSSELHYCKDLRVKDSFQLFALFLSPHTRLLDNTEREDWAYKSVKENLSSKVTELLPGLQYAILESRQMQRGHNFYPDALVEQHFKKFARLQRKNVRAGGVKGDPSSTSSRSPGHGKDVPDKCDQLAFSCLQSYFSSPVNFSVPLVKMASLLKEDIPLSSDSEKGGKNMVVKDSIALESKILLAANKMKSDSLSENNVLNENKKQPTKKRSFKRGGKRGPRKGRRKHTHQAALTAAAASENLVSSKKRKLIGGDQQQAVSSNKTTVKLASAPNTHSRKRGAEVLTAEFVNDDKASETETTATSKRNKEQSAVLKTKIVTGKPKKAASAEDAHVVRERPPKRKASEPGNKNKLPEKVKSEIIKKAVIKHQEQSGKPIRKATESISAAPCEPAGSSKKSGAARSSPAKRATPPAPAAENNIIEKRISMYESHALNLLADLALNSFSSSSMSYMNSEEADPVSEPTGQETASGADKGNAAEEPQNDGSPVSQPSTAAEEPVQSPDSVKSQPKVGSDGSQGNSMSQQRAESSEKQASHKMLLAAAKAKARSNATSKICLEHSYSQLPRDDVPDKSSKEPNEKPLLSGSESAVSSPDSDEVLDPSSDLFFPREFLLLAGDNGCSPLNKEPREVSKLRENFIITFKWEPTYDFDLDSKFTSDPLEKTINRALHGPWNPHLKEKVEDVKIILHMWLALFYSKPSLQLSSSSRKVVEHSNPAKYVSINTVHDPLYELAEADDATNDDEGDPAQPDNMADVSLEWHEMRDDHRSNQPVDLSPSSKMQKPVTPRGDSEHEYSRNFTSAEETQGSSDSEKDVSLLHDESYLIEDVTDNDMPVSPGPVSRTQAEAFTLHDDGLRQIGGDNDRATARKGHVPSNTIDAACSPSDALNANAHVFREDGDGRSDQSHSQKGFPEKRSPLASRLQHLHASPEQHKTALQSRDGRDLTEAKLQDLKVGQRNEEQEPDTSHHSLTASINGSELGIREENDDHVDDLKSRFGEKQTNVCKTKDPSGLTGLNYGSVAAPSEDEKALGSGIQLSDDNLPTLQSPKAQRSSPALARSELSSMDGERQGRARSEVDLLAERVKEGDSCPGSEVHDGKDSRVEEEQAGSFTNEEICGKRSEQSSDELEECQKVSSLLAKNDTHEVQISAFGKMGKLHLSSSSSDISDIEDMETDHAGRSGPAPPEETEVQKSHSDEEPDVVDTCAGTSVDVFHQDDVRSPKHDGGHESGNTVADQTSDHIIEINGTVKIDESLPVPSQSPFPPVVIGDRVLDLAPVSADFQTKVDSNFIKSGEVEIISEIDKSEDPADDVQILCDQETMPPIGADISGEGPKAHFVEKSSMIYCETVDLESPGDEPSLLASESNKVVDCESLGVKSMLLGSESDKAVDLESLEEKSSLLGSELTITADLVSIVGKPIVHGTESSDSSDLECISVFEKLSLKPVTEAYPTQIPTLAQERELHIHDGENLPAEIKSMDNNPSVDLLSMLTDPGAFVEVANDCEMVQEPSSETPTKATPTGTLAGKSNSKEITQDPDGATNQTLSKCVDENVDLLIVESQGDSTSDDISVNLSPAKPKDQTQNMRNTIRKEILSKLKRICRGAGFGQHASSNSEDEVVIVHEKPGKWKAGEQTKQTNNAIANLPSQELNSVSPAKSTNETQEDQTSKSDILEEQTEQEMATSDTSVTLPEPVVLKEAEKSLPPDKCVSKLHDEFTDHMDQDAGQDKSEICCILTTGSISKEQYERWSESSDDDVEFVRSYKEPLLNQASKYFQKECREFPTSQPEELTPNPEPSQPRKAKHFKRHSGPSASQREADEYVSRYHRDPDYPSPRSHGSFIITKKLKDVGRTWPAVHKERFHAGRADLDSRLTTRRVVSSDLTQNTLDMEHLRFMCRLKEVLRKSSADVHVSEPPFQTMFDSRRIPGCSRSRMKCRSPLLITVRCKQRRRDYRGHDGLFPSSSYSQAYYEDEPREKPAYYSRTPKKVRTHRHSPPYHFNRLRYESALEKPNSDISVIIKECTQSNHQKLSRVGLGSTAAERTSACPVPEESDWPIRQTTEPAATKSRTVGNIITDLCTNLRTKLHSVARESAQRNCYFYLSKNVDGQDDDDDFFSLTKSLLIKDGYILIDPKDFCEIEQAESSKLLVVIRNENVSSQIHKIPHLLQLRLLPNVRFAGVDTPEDLSESMHQELFQTGGFVVSDKSVLENITIGKLKEVLSILEKMNRTSVWKWLIHYGEYRKLKEDKRAESVSRSKIPLLKSYQQSNIIEILPYHRCDSRSKDLSSDLECLLSLQSQHIRARLAVWLTVTPSTEAEEMEQNGILVYDVDTFIRRIQKVDSQLQTSFAS